MFHVGSLQETVPRLPNRVQSSIFYMTTRYKCDFDVDVFLEFTPQTSVTKGHNKKLIKPICNNNWQLNLFLVELLTKDPLVKNYFRG